MFHVKSKKCDHTRLTWIYNQCWKSNWIPVHDIYKSNTTAQMNKNAPKHVLQVDYKKKHVDLIQWGFCKLVAHITCGEACKFFLLKASERELEKMVFHTYIWRDRSSSFHANHVFVKHTWLKYHIAHENGQKMILTAQYHSFMSEQSLGIHQL